MKVRAIIQARMGSTRLRGKTLTQIDGKTLLERVVNTVNSLPFVTEVLVATTVDIKDDPVEEFCNIKKINVFRGSEFNVLDRFFSASIDLTKSDHIIRITADNPLNWIELSTSLYNIHERNGNDYTCVDGLSHTVCEIINVGALREVVKAPNLTKYDIEHVTPYFRNNKEKFKISEIDFGHLGFDQTLDKFLTIDTLDDLLRFKQMVKHINFDKKINFKEVYTWLENYLADQNQIIK